MATASPELVSVVRQALEAELAPLVYELLEDVVRERLNGPMGRAQCARWQGRRGG